MSGTVTGEQADVFMACHSGAGSVQSWTSKDHSTFSVSDFSLTFDRGTVEQELVGQIGNFFTKGSLSIEGSLSQCKFGTSGNCDLLENMVNGTGAYEYVSISGCIDDDDKSNTIRWYLVSCQVTGYDVTMGDADTITEASIDFVVLDPYNVTCTSGYITDVS